MSIENIIKITIWPLLILLLVLLFQQPIFSFLNGLANSSADVAKFKIGTLEIEFDPRAVETTSSAIGTAITGLNLNELRILLEYDEPTGDIADEGGPCFTEGLESERFAHFKRLADRSLIFLVEATTDGDFCDNPHSVSLTPLGKGAQHFVTELLVEQLSGLRIEK